MPAIKDTTSCLTVERLRELLNYDSETGVFVWKVNRRRARAGTVAGSVGSHGYIKIMIDGSNYYAHRLVFLWLFGRWPAQQIDHKNHRRTDNRWTNLRDDIDSITQHRNYRMSPKNSSGFTGVSWYKGTKKWRARIQVHGKFLHLGCFAEIEDAIAARKAANIKYSFHKNHGAP